VKTHLLYVTLTASVLMASWGGAFGRLLGWADGS
jgi:hypothetical protein